MTDTLFFISFISVSRLLEHVVRDLPYSIFNRGGGILWTFQPLKSKLWVKNCVPKKDGFRKLGHICICRDTWVMQWQHTKDIRSYISLLSSTWWFYLPRVLSRIAFCDRVLRHYMALLCFIPITDDSWFNFMNSFLPMLHETCTILPIQFLIT